MDDCNNSFHGSLSEDLSPVRGGNHYGCVLNVEGINRMKSILRLVGDWVLILMTIKLY